MGVSASACSCYTCILIIDHPNWAEGLWGEGEEVERRKARKIFISAPFKLNTLDPSLVFYFSHGMRRETTCNHFSLALFCLMERNLLSASYMCVILHPYTGCIEPGVNWDMLLRQSLSEHWDLTILDRTIRYHTVPYRTIQDQTGPYRTIWDHTEPYRIILD